MAQNIKPIPALPNPETTPPTVSITARGSVSDSVANPRSFQNGQMLSFPSSQVTPGKENGCIRSGSPGPHSDQRPASSPDPAMPGSLSDGLSEQKPLFFNNVEQKRSPSPGLPSPAFSPNDVSRSSSPYLSVSSPSTDGTSSPPKSPTPQMAQEHPHDIRQVIYSSNQCKVFRWQNKSWYAVEGECVLQVRQTYSNRSCVMVQLQDTKQIYLNAWIFENTTISQPYPTDVSLSITINNKKETYLFHFQQVSEATALYQTLHRSLQTALKNHDSSSRASMAIPPSLMRSDTLQDKEGAIDNRPLIPQTLHLVMQCKCKLFVQNEHSNWSSFGSVAMKISQQIPSKKMHIEMENSKSTKTKKLVSATVYSRNVERISSRRITFLLTNEEERTSMVYMVQIKEEETGDKIYNYLRTKNAEHGW